MRNRISLAVKNLFDDWMAGGIRRRQRTIGRRSRHGKDQRRFGRVPGGAGSRDYGPKRPRRPASRVLCDLSTTARPDGGSTARHRIALRGPARDLLYLGQRAQGLYLGVVYRARIERNRRGHHPRLGIWQKW